MENVGTGGLGTTGGVIEASAAAEGVVLSPETLWKQKAEEAEAKIGELEAVIESLKGELSVANEMVASVERRHQIEQEVSRADAVDLETACLLTEVAVGEMDEPDVALAVRELRSRKPFLFSGGGGGKVGGGSSMSAMVSGDGHGGRESLDGLAGQARQSGDRSELLRYLRARRGG